MNKKSVFLNSRVPPISPVRANPNSRSRYGLQSLLVPWSRGAVFCGRAASGDLRPDLSAGGRQPHVMLPISFMFLGRGGGVTVVPREELISTPASKLHLTKEIGGFVQVDF
ncbi:unnamed protein product [Arabidopsis lyrata]|nr:unnamed protein product [Arabidopsis lyrata]